MALFQTLGMIQEVHAMDKKNRRATPAGLRRQKELLKQ